VLVAFFVWRSESALTARAIAPHKYSLLLAREAHSSHTAQAATQGFISVFEEGGVIGRQPCVLNHKIERKQKPRLRGK